MTVNKITGAHAGGVQLAVNANNWVRGEPVPGGLMYKLVPKASISCTPTSVEKLPPALQKRL